MHYEYLNLFSVRFVFLIEPLHDKVIFQSYKIRENEHVNAAYLEKLQQKPLTNCVTLFHLISQVPQTLNSRKYYI